MNTRRITEIIVLGAGLNSGIITSAVVTTPLLKLLRLGRWEARPTHE